MNINSKLVAFAQNELVLSHNDTERSKIEASIGHLETILKDKLGEKITEFIRFGSFTRNTILPRKYDAKSDVDLMVVFDTSMQRFTPGTYRKYLNDVISAAYPSSVSKKDFPAIKLELNHIMFDIVPAYCQDFIYQTYFIPGANDGWIKTTPNDINDRLKYMNVHYGNNILRNTIRLCKHWNAGAGYPLESYLMEKEMIDIRNWGVDDTYERFLKTMKRIVGTRPGVKEALAYIEQYKGGWTRPANEEKQFEWLQKLLPGLK